MYPIIFHVEFNFQLTRGL